MRGWLSVSSTLDRLQSSLGRHRPEAVLVDVDLFEVVSADAVARALPRQAVLLIRGCHAAGTGASRKCGIRHTRLTLASGRGGLEEGCAATLVAAIRAKAASRGPVDRNDTGGPQSSAGMRRGPSLGASARPPDESQHEASRGPLILIGASTGGTMAIEKLLRKAPAHMPAMLITQHLPGRYSRAFCERLDASSKLRVVPAENNMAIYPSHAYVAAGGAHLEIRANGFGYKCRTSKAPPVNRHRPSVDVMFHAVAREARCRVLAMLLTGMGRDGAAGMEALHQQQAVTVVQDEQTRVVWSMPLV